MSATPRPWKAIKGLVYIPEGAGNAWTATGGRGHAQRIVTAVNSYDALVAFVATVREELAILTDLTGPTVPIHDEFDRGAWAAREDLRQTIESRIEALDAALGGGE